MKKLLLLFAVLTALSIASSVYAVNKLAKPTNLQLEGSGETLTLTWDVVTNADYYTVRLITQDVELVKKWKKTTTTSLNISALVEQGSTYKFKVRACSESNCGKWSKYKQFEVPIVVTEEEEEQPVPVENNNSIICSSDTYNCADFSTQAEAQSVYNTCMAEVGKDIHRLDSDNDDVACESLD
ncbi:MAG: fibronectin type III domain-containing protein [Patescibacteria group bacterium]|jgi:uncharacterized membrane protein